MTNLRQEAYLTNVTPVSSAARVNAGTFTLPFSLSYTPARVTGNVTVAGTQPQMPAATTPPGGVRVDL